MRVKINNIYPLIDNLNVLQKELLENYIFPGMQKENDFELDSIRDISDIENYLDDSKINWVYIRIDEEVVAFETSEEYFTLYLDSLEVPEYTEVEDVLWGRGENYSKVEKFILSNDLLGKKVEDISEVVEPLLNHLNINFLDFDLVFYDDEEDYNLFG